MTWLHLILSCCGRIYRWSTEITSDLWFLVLLAVLENINTCFSLFCPIKLILLPSAIKPLLHFLWHDQITNKNSEYTVTGLSWNWGLYHILSVLEVSSFPLFSYEMQKYSEFYLVKQIDQIVTEMQIMMPCGIPKSSAMHLSVPYTQGASRTDKMKWDQVKERTNL